MGYIGRFAPSPTGPLHFGSLVAAVASYCDAKENQGQWLVRMEDLDQPREVPGAASNILNTLEAYGFEWDGEVMFQSQRADAYQTALDQLKHRQLIYPCTCSRKKIEARATKTGIEGPVYPKTCIQQPLQPNAPKAWRIKTTNETVTFEDVIAGMQTQVLADDIGDFVLKRADGVFAYQLAVVVDDAAQAVTHVVRGADLLTSTARQIYLQQKLGFQSPTYAHTPIVTNNRGEKLSKQTHAASIKPHEAVENLVKAFEFLNLQPPQYLFKGTLSDCWTWALAGKNK